MKVTHGRWRRVAPHVNRQSKLLWTENGVCPCGLSNRPREHPCALPWPRGSALEQNVVRGAGVQPWESFRDEPLRLFYRSQRTDGRRRNTPDD